MPELLSSKQILELDRSAVQVMEPKKSEEICLYGGNSVGYVDYAFCSSHGSAIGLAGCRNIFKCWGNKKAVLDAESVVDKLCFELSEDENEEENDY